MKRSLLAAAILASLSVPAVAESDIAVGAGFGIPYGGLGVNFSHALNDQFEVMAALGTTGVAGMGKAIGVTAFFSEESDRGWRSSLIYGTNTILEEQDFFGDSEYESFDGLNLSIGWGSKAQRSGWNFDLILILTTEADDRVDELKEEGVPVEDDTSDIAISFGYQWSL
ncbi:MAG: hypothetical protein CMI09_04175 [Oceanospirillaceae bacterium]|nr:hypothetical protein [Oceanospirillaceae bacterium]|tara:strand:+ start:598 stop:1104 length:507 start_codon:yes stop_codon:yes gene_type:complete